MINDKDDEMLSKVENLLNGDELKKNRKRTLLQSAIATQRLKFEKKLVDCVLSHNDLFTAIERRNELMSQIAAAEQKIAENVTSAVYSAIDSKEGKALNNMLSSGEFATMDRRFIAADIHSIVRNSENKKMTEKALLGTHFI
jgi:hypothetical protein